MWLKDIIDYVMNLMSESPEKMVNSDSTEGITTFVRDPEAQATIRKTSAKIDDFYQTAKRLPPHALSGFSCDWESWGNSTLFITASYDNLSYMDTELKSFGLKPPVRLVAYQREELCVIEAGGTYYSFDFEESELMRLNDAPNDEMALKEFNRPGQVKMELLEEYF